VTPNHQQTGNSSRVPASVLKKGTKKT